jgi:hypothetical protein
LSGVRARRAGGSGGRRHACPFEAPSEGRIFDLVATGGGALKVDTKAGTAGDRWRTTIVVVDTKTVESNVGTGSATSFTGLVQRNVANRRRYEVLAADEPPWPEPFRIPSRPPVWGVRFWGPAPGQNHVTIAGPRPSGPGALQSLEHPWNRLGKPRRLPLGTWGYPGGRAVSHPALYGSRGRRDGR